MLPDLKSTLGYHGKTSGFSAISMRTLASGLGLVTVRA
jgi:hypothetical protein